MISIIISIVVGTVTYLAGRFRRPAKRTQDWEEAGDLTKILSGKFRNFARHGVANAHAIINVEKEADEFNLRLVALRCKYENSYIDDYRKNAESVLSSEYIQLVDHYYILSRNINIASEEIAKLEHISASQLQTNLFVRNIRLAKICHEAASFLEDVSKTYFPQLEEAVDIQRRGYIDRLKNSLEVLSKMFRRYVDRWIFVLRFESTKIASHRRIRDFIPDLSAVKWDDLVELTDKYYTPYRQKYKEKRAAYEHLFVDQ